MEKYQLDFEQSAELLSLYDIQVPGKVVYTIEDALNTAESVGYPVVAKAVSNKIIHKSDQGAVLLNLKNKDQVTSAAQSIENIMGGFSKQEKEGLLIQKMAEKGFELLVGARQDPGFGPITMVGIGGIYVELFSDAAPGIGILTRQDVERMLENTRQGLFWMVSEGRFMTGRPLYP